MVNVGKYTLRPMEKTYGQPLLRWVSQQSQERSLWFRSLELEIKRSHGEMSRLPMLPSEPMMDGSMGGGRVV